jgi:hypothetical protein
MANPADVTLFFGTKKRDATPGAHPVNDLAHLKFGNTGGYCWVRHQRNLCQFRGKIIVPAGFSFSAFPVLRFR